MTIKAAVLAGMFSIVAMAAMPAQAQHVTSDRVVGAGYQLIAASSGLINKPVKTADHFFYNPMTGLIVVGITNHPQRSGFNGETFAPGDCWGTYQSGLTGAKMQVGDLDGDGLTNDILLHRFEDGAFRQIRINLFSFFPGCDTSDF